MSKKLTAKVSSLLEAERGTIYKDHSNRLSFAIGFPNVYRLGMSTLGLQIVYGLLNNDPDVVAERVFLPDPEDLQEYHRTQTRLFTLESQTPVRDFDVFALSISFEMDYIHILEMLQLAGIPLRSADRDESHPIVLAGGPVVTFNPEPVADFLDVIVIGEAEDTVPDIVDVLKNEESKSRLELLAALAKVEGVYVPSLYTPHYNEDGTISHIEASSTAPEKVKRRKTVDLSRHSGASVITTPNCEFPDMVLTEVIRGCSRHCRFCVAGYMNLPPRPREDINMGEGPARAGLVGSAVFDHPEAFAICENLLEEGRDFSVSSIRVETLTPELASMMYKGGQRTMTIAPEAGSERLRRVINKPLTDEQIFEAVEIGLTAGFTRIKLYYMVGLPGELDEDVDQIVEMAKILSTRYTQAHFQVSASCYVPKPWTPFQWCAMDQEKNLSSKFSRVKKSLAGVKRVQFSGESPRLAVVQALLARGDRRLASYLEKAVELDGNYAAAAFASGTDIAFYTTRIRPEDEVMPWDHLDLLVDKSYLRAELRKAFELKVTPACKVGICHLCGVC